MSAVATIAELEGLLRGTGITALILSTPTETITLRREPGRQEPGHGQPGSDQAELVAPAAESAVCVIAAPCSGVFLHRHPLREDLLVQLGQLVQASTVLGVLRVGPLLLHVVAPRAGIVAAIVTPENAVIGYGTPLIHLVDEKAA